MRYTVMIFDTDGRTLRIFAVHTDPGDAERDAEDLRRAFPNRKVIVQSSREIIGDGHPQHGQDFGPGVQPLDGLGFGFDIHDPVLLLGIPTR